MKVNLARRITVIKVSGEPKRYGHDQIFFYNLAIFEILNEPKVELFHEK